MKKNLFEIEQDFINLMREIEDAEGVLDETLEAKLEINKQDFEQKFINYRRMVLAKEAHITYLKDEKKRFDSNIKSSQNFIDRLKDRQIKALRLFGNINSKTGNASYDFTDFKASEYQLSTVLEDEFGINQLISNIKDSIFQNNYSVSFEQFTFSVTFAIDSEAKFKQFIKLKDIMFNVNEEIIPFTIDVKPNKSAIKELLERSNIADEDKLSDYEKLIRNVYSIGKSDVLKIK